MEMERNLTIYLLNTLNKLHKGLKVKLKIFKVNGSMETFCEEDNPCAAILPQGLFLACVTPPHVKDPLLVSVLNQSDLTDGEPDNQLAVVWHSQRTRRISSCANNILDGNQSADPENMAGESPSPKPDLDEIRMEQRVSLVKHGIVKHVPPSAEFDSQVAEYLDGGEEELSQRAFCARTLPGLEVSVLDADHDRYSGEMTDMHNWYTWKNPTRIFLSVVQTWYDEHMDTVSRAKSIHEIPDLPTTLETDMETKLSLLHHLHIKAICSMLTNMQNCLEYYQHFLPAQSQEDSVLYETNVSNTKEALHSLATAVKTVLLEPFSEVLNGFHWNSAGHMQPNLETGRLVVQQATEWIQKLLKLSATPNDQVGGFGREKIPIPIYGLLGESNNRPPTLDCIKFQRFSQLFFQKLTLLLPRYPIELRNLNNAIELVVRVPPKPKCMHQFMMYDITHMFGKLNDKFVAKLADFRLCLTKSAKGMCRPVRFFTGLGSERRWRLVAVVCKQDIKVCLSLLDFTTMVFAVYGFIATTTAVVQVFRREVLIATFKFEPGESLNHPRFCRPPLQYYTGRYFILYQRSDAAVAYGTVLVLDFDPCFQPTPAPPHFFQERFGALEPGHQHSRPIFTCNDKFLTFMWVQEIPIDQGEPLYKPVILQLIGFSSPEGFATTMPISCGEHFEAITQSINKNWVYHEVGNGTQLCWFSDLKTLFYARWLLAGTRSDTNTLFLGCFRVSGCPPSISTTAFTCFHLADMIESELLVGVQPNFTTLRTRVREYLVMDLKPLLERGLFEAKQPQATLARVLFAVHKCRIHWVPVNAKLVTRIPWHIGAQIIYPGYETSQISLFHHRRIFSSQKVIFALHRLHYIPI